MVGGQKAAILAQMGQFYSDDVGQYYSDANNSSLGSTQISRKRIQRYAKVAQIYFARSGSVLPRAQQCKDLSRRPTSSLRMEVL